MLLNPTQKNFFKKNQDENNNFLWQECLYGSFPPDEPIWGSAPPPMPIHKSENAITHWP